MTELCTQLLIPLLKTQTALATSKGRLILMQTSSATLTAYLGVAEHTRRGCKDFHTTLMNIFWHWAYAIVSSVLFSLVMSHAGLEV